MQKLLKNQTDQNTCLVSESERVGNESWGGRCTMIGEGD